MRAEIVRQQNGFSATFGFCTFVYEDGEEQEFERVQPFVDLLWKLVEEFGMVGSRYDAQRINIEIIPGDKHE